jgi:hypothetical protein
MGVQPAGVFNALRCLVRTRAAWQVLPHDFPQDDGTPPSAATTRLRTEGAWQKLYLRSAIVDTADLRHHTGKVVVVSVRFPFSSDPHWWPRSCR